MKDNEFRPRPSDSGGQHFVDGALSELARSDKDHDEAFLSQMESRLDEVESELDVKNPQSAGAPRRKAHRAFWVSSAAAAGIMILILGGLHFVTQQGTTVDAGAGHTVVAVAEEKPFVESLELQRSSPAGLQPNSALFKTPVENEALTTSPAVNSQPTLDNARRLADQGRYDEAEGIAESLAKHSFDSSVQLGAKRLLEQIENPEIYSPALPPAHLERIREIESKAKPLQQQQPLNRGYADAVGATATVPKPEPAPAAPASSDKLKTGGPQPALAAAPPENASQDVLYGGLSLSVDFGDDPQPAPKTNAATAAPRDSSRRQTVQTGRTMSRSQAANQQGVTREYRSAGGRGAVKRESVLSRNPAPSRGGRHPAEPPGMPRPIPKPPRPVPEPPPRPHPVPSGERYGTLVDNAFDSPLQKPLSTFSIDVDTASYSNIRRLVTQGLDVPADAVRIEEMINYFSYDYPQPKEKHPFAFAVETAECPWEENHQLLRVGIQGKSMPRDQRPAANLVFLVDVSGSMSPSNKLPLVKKCLELLVEELTERDTISIVVYAGAEGLCLKPTPGARKKEILGALGEMSAGGSTNGGAGIQLAYKLARENHKKNGINRVILCTDGDFNVGRTEENDLVKLVKKQAASGTFLSVLGYGAGNINDSMLEAITNHGNGNYFYIDSLREGRKVLMRDLMSTLVTIAKDVKIQIEFNPKHVQHYRLIGYANRMLRAEDFGNDRIDAGEVGAGRSVTALYEIVPAGAPPVQRDFTELKYQKPARPAPPKMKIVESDELCTVKLRYKKPKEKQSILMEQPAVYRSREWKEASKDFQLSAGAALWGMLLRESEYAGSGDATLALELVREGKGADPFGRREELINLIGKWSEQE